MHVFAPLPIGRFEYTCLIFICSINICISYISVISRNLLESGIPMLIGDNFVDRKHQILLTLGCMELDLALHVDEPPIPMVESAQVDKENYERW